MAGESVLSVVSTELDCGIHKEPHIYPSGSMILSLIFLPWVSDVFFSVSWEVKKTSGNSGQLTDRAAPIGFK